MRRSLVWALASLGLLGLWVDPVSAAPQTFNTALPVAQGEFVFREQLLWLEATGDPSPADRELNVLGAVSVLGYGVTGNLAVFGMLPYLDKELEVTTPTDGQQAHSRDCRHRGCAPLRALHGLSKRRAGPNFPHCAVSRARTADGR